MENPKQTFQNNIDKYNSTILKLTKKLNELSTYRLVAFVFSIILITILANERAVDLLLIVLPLCITGFAVLVKHYNQVAFLNRHTTFLKEINENEISKLENKLSDFPTGQTFIKRDHPYVADLDIFGSHSIFQLLNRTTTETGNVMLAEWLAEAASKAVILERQQAVREMAPKLDWRQDFQASGMPFRNPKSDYQKLLAWIEMPLRLLPYQYRYLGIGIFLSVLSTLAIIFAFSSGSLPGNIPLLIILTINYQILKKVKSTAEEIIKNLHHNIKILGAYHALILKIESENFHSEILQRLQAAFSQDLISAAGEINKLKKILAVFQLRGVKGELSNQFYPFFNLLWLFDIYYIILTERWKFKNRPYLNSWTSAVSEFEVLNSLAGFYYSNPSYTFPKINEEPYVIHFEKLGHPLINRENRVCNDFILKGQGKIAMITGSNMAGKSTFLRTVGANLALALMGAPCCASSGQVSNMKIFSSMRTQDNLEEGISSFYAELRRIEQLLNLIESGQPIFFLLDEMFKGTNSKDRHKGGFSLIKQLGELNAFGIISTHDLELASLAGKHFIVSNFSFNSEIRDGEMYFNYELTPGLCKDFNASELMKKSGIKILSRIEEM